MRRGRKTKPIKKQKLEGIFTRLDSELFGIVKQLAQAEDLSYSQIARRALREYVQRIQKIEKVA